MKLHIHKTKEEVAKQVAKYLSKLASDKNDIHIALSGGSTPKIVFQELASHYADTIDWTGIHIYWGDERCVSPTDNESNYKMTADLLLSQISIPDKNIFRIHGEAQPAEEARRYAVLLERVVPYFNGRPQFDLVMLGMGDDGHTASIFPESKTLWNAPENCVVAVHPISGQERITLTGRVINNAREVAFLVTGTGKAEKVREVIRKEGNFGNYPASLVSPSPGELHWFLDKEAAAGLT